MYLPAAKRQGMLCILLLNNKILTLVLLLKINELFFKIGTHPYNNAYDYETAITRQ